jgi:hypothetical protein
MVNEMLITCMVMTSRWPRTMFRFLGRLIERTRGSGIAQPSCDNGFEVRKEGFIGCLQTESDYDLWAQP